jgi:hypothetical protein
LERSTALIGDAPAAAASPSSARLVVTGSQRSTISRSLRGARAGPVSRLVY